VPLEELASQCGYGHEWDRLPELAREMAGVEISSVVGPDWAGRASVPVETASEVLRGVLARQEWNDAKHDAYRRYEAEREEAGRQERIRIAEKQAAERKREQARVAQMNAEQRARQAQVAAAELREEQAKAAKRRGNPVPFADFKFPRDAA
jgi:hypothetical protein